MILVLLFIFLQIVSNNGDTLTDVKSHPNWKLLNHYTCGSTISYHIIGGKNAPIGAYPWIVRLGYIPTYKTGEKVNFRCAGSVINRYYVITAAHCLTEKNLILSVVRLGEHNAETNPDCDKSICNEPYVDLKPHKIIVHKDYNQPKRRNDIGLIRVKKEIKYSDFIRPICIMKEKMLQKNFVGHKAEVAGWGVTNIREPQVSTILKQLSLPIQNNRRCEISYGKYASISTQQLCVGGEIGYDTCKGDSGGPLMKVGEDDALMGTRYYLIGIVSFGGTLCGETTRPGVYTNVAKYLFWILDHLEP